MKIHQLSIVIFLLLCAYCITISTAQETSPIVELLSMIPDTPEVRQSIVTYGDIETAIRLRGTPPIASYEGWQVLRDAGDRGDAVGELQRQDWLNALPWSIPNAFRRALQAPELTPELMGINLFAIQQTVEVEHPSDNILLLAGDFDEESILSVYEAKGYTSQADSSLTYLCPADACDSGMVDDPDNVQFSNLFGGELGRHQSIGLGDNILFSSPSEAMMDAMLATETDEAPSMMEDAIFSTSVHAMLDLGEIRAATFVMDTESMRVFTETFEPEADALVTFPDNLEIVPDFELLAFADTVDAANELERAAIILVYESEADAQAATDALVTNFNNPDLYSLRRSITFSFWFEDNGITLVQESIYADAETGHYAARIILEAPLVRYGTVSQIRGDRREVVEELPAEGWQVTQSSINYYLLTYMLEWTDFGWLYLSAE
jgi:hypothetical protein